MNRNLPSIEQIYGGVTKKKEHDALIAIMNNPPHQSWVKVHPFIKNYKYIPIERIEFLLKSFFRSYRIEITGQGQSFNGVWVTVRVHYQHPVSGEWQYHDGIGAEQLQTAKGTSPADLGNINNGALGMAFPIAKTRAIKDACDHFGRLFGSDLNRKEEMPYKEAELYFDESHPKWEKTIKALKAGTITIDGLKETYSLTEEQIEKLCELTK